MKGLVDYSKGIPRNCALLQSPFPGDKRFQHVQAHDERFDMPDINMEILTKHHNTKIVPKLENYAKRKLHWKEVSDLPDGNYYSVLDQKPYKD